MRTDINLKRHLREPTLIKREPTLISRLPTLAAYKSTPTVAYRQQNDSGIPTIVSALKGQLWRDNFESKTLKGQLWKANTLMWADINVKLSKQKFESRTLTAKLRKQDFESKNVKEKRWNKNFKRLTLKGQLGKQFFERPTLKAWSGKRQ
jgi:hypothetical protein